MSMFLFMKIMFMFTRSMFFTFVYLSIPPSVHPPTLEPYRTTVFPLGLYVYVSGYMLQLSMWSIQSGFLHRVFLMLAQTTGQQKEHIHTQMHTQKHTQKHAHSHTHNL